MVLEERPQAVPRDKDAITNGSKPQSKDAFSQQKMGKKKKRAKKDNQQQAAFCRHIEAPAESAI